MTTILSTEIYPIFNEDETLKSIKVVIYTLELGRLMFFITPQDVSLTLKANGDLNDEAAVKLKIKEKFETIVTQLEPVVEAKKAKEEKIKGLKEKIKLKVNVTDLGPKAKEPAPPAPEEIVNPVGNVVPR